MTQGFRQKHGLALLGILLSAAATPVTGAELEASANLASRFPWRGFTRADGWVLQPDLHLRNILGQGLFLRAWGSTAVQDPDRQLVEDEVDLIGGITRKVGSLRATAAATVSFFPAAGTGRRRTQELWSALQGSVRVADLDLRPQLLAAHDFGFYDATYVRLGVFPPLDFKRKTRLYLRLWAGFGNFAVAPGRREFRFQDASGEADVELRPWSNKNIAFSFGPRLTREEVTAARWHFWFGAGVSHTRALSW